MAELSHDATADVIDGVPEEEVRLCLFSIGEDYYAIPVTLLTEIIIPQKIYPVPTTPPHVLGVINLRGAIVPIVDIRPALGLPPVAGTGQIAILKHEATVIGIVVDNVVDVLAVPESSLLDMPADHGLPSEGKGRGRFLKSILQREEGVAALLDVDRVLEAIKLG